MEGYWFVMSKEMLPSLPSIFVNMNTTIAMHSILSIQASERTH